MKNQWRLIAGIVLILLIITFAVLNVDHVPVNYGFGKITAPLIIIIFVSLLVGSLLTLLVSTTSSTRTNRELRTLRKEVENQTLQTEEKVTHTKSEYQERITQLEDDLVQKENKIKDLEEELVNQVTYENAGLSTENSTTPNDQYTRPE